MRGFDARSAKGEELRKWFVEWLQDHGIDYAETGYETLKTGGAFRGRITSMGDVASLLLRHHPDMMIVLSGESHFVEVKNSSGIERECYEAYMKLQSLGPPVWILSKQKTVCQIQEVLFCPMNGYDRIASMQIPVIDGIWKAPRQLLPDDKQAYFSYLQAYRSRGKSTSGCTFAFIDFMNSDFQPIEIFLDSGCAQQEGTSIVTHERENLNLEDDDKEKGRQTAIQGKLF